MLQLILEFCQSFDDGLALVALDLIITGHHSTVDIINGSCLLF